MIAGVLWRNIILFLQKHLKICLSSFIFFFGYLSRPRLISHSSFFFCSPPQLTRLAIILSLRRIFVLLFSFANLAQGEAEGISVEKNVSKGKVKIRGMSGERVVYREINAGELYHRKLFMSWISHQFQRRPRVFGRVLMRTSREGLIKAFPRWGRAGGWRGTTVCVSLPTIYIYRGTFYQNQEYKGNRWRVQKRNHLYTSQFSPRILQDTANKRFLLYLIHTRTYMPFPSMRPKIYTCIQVR